MIEEGLDKNLLQMELNLYEHQSTFNPNISLRDLFYIARELEKLTVRKSLYSDTLVKIPTLRFVVFYNGTSDQPECRLLKLSDAYEKRMEKWRSLKEYMLYVSKVREYTAAEGIPAAKAESLEEFRQKMHSS